MGRGNPRRALPIYLGVLPRVQRYRSDLPLFRAEYAGLLNSLALAYMDTGDDAESPRYFAESLAAMPDQPDVEAYLSHLRRGAPVTAAP